MKLEGRAPIVDLLFLHILHEALKKTFDKRKLSVSACPLAKLLLIGNFRDLGFELLAHQGSEHEK